MPHRGIAVSRVDEMAERTHDDSSFVDCTFDGGSFVSNAKRYVPVEGEIARTYRPLRQEV